MNILVTNLSVNVLAGDLKRLFAPYGDVLMAVIYRNGSNSRSLGTAMVEMPNDSQAAQAILCLNNTLLDGRKIELREDRHGDRDRNN